jgi:hypothetical protein
MILFGRQTIFDLTFVQLVGRYVWRILIALAIAILPLLLVWQPLLFIAIGGGIVVILFGAKTVPVIIRQIRQIELTTLIRTLKLLEKYRLSAEEEAKFIEAEKSRYKAIEKALKTLIELSETRSLAFKNLERAIRLCKKSGYSTEEIQELVGPQLQKLFQTHDDRLFLKQLAEDGVIVDDTSRQLKRSSQS